MFSRHAPLILPRLLVLGLCWPWPAFAANPEVEQRDAVLRRLAGEAGQTAPLMRIGLDDGHSLTLSSRGGFRVLDAQSGEPVWRERFAEAIQVVAFGGPTGEVERRYRVQIGAFATREAAESELARVAAQVGVAGVVHHDPDRQTYRVRIGDQPDRLALNPLLERLRHLGLQALWIAEEPVQVAGEVQLRLVDASYDSQFSQRPRLAVVPASSQPVQINGTAYRGIIELRVTDFGTVRPVNWIEMENYLLGVVPVELGPEVWPQLQALQAQAVAARTYAFSHVGQFEDEGFDLCAGPRCQAYGGASAEHPLSDRAVAATRGEILTFAGKPISALYTATCGGHTENGVNVFADHDAPYLQGVPCYAEPEAMATLRGTVAGQALRPLRDETGLDVTRDWAVLAAAGVLPRAAEGQARPGEPLEATDLRDWTRRVAALAGRPQATGEVGAVVDLGGAARALLEGLGWTERARVLLSGEDLPALLRDDEARNLPDAERRALAYLAWIEGLQPFPDGRFRVAERPSRARLVPALARFCESFEALGLKEAVVSGVGQDSLRMVRGNGELRLALAAEPYLFGLSAGRSVPLARLELWPNDRVRYRTDARGEIDFLELRPPIKGAADDRTARVYSWEERKTRRQVEATIERQLSVGKLQDLRVVSRGVSGRIVELQVVGARESTIVRGFDVRRLLDLRESLTVIEIQRDAEGEIRGVVFAGKGWGHGVGLCQVGAYGMALRGKDYREILAHYYRGTAVTDIGRRAAR